MSVITADSLLNGLFVKYSGVLTPCRYVAWMPYYHGRKDPTHVVVPTKLILVVVGVTSAELIEGPNVIHRLSDGLMHFVANDQMISMSVHKLRNIRAFQLNDVQSPVCTEKQDVVLIE